METNAATIKNQNKKRGPFFSQNARKRSRPARVSSSGEKQVVSESASCDSAAAVVASRETSVLSKALKGPDIPTSYPVLNSRIEGCDVKEWTCEKCTLVNPINRKRCQACGSREPLKASVPSVESSDNSLPRRVYSTPRQNNPLHSGTSIVVKLVDKLDTPKTRKSEKVRVCIENSLPHQRVTRSAHTRTEIDDEERKFDGNDKKGGNVFPSGRSSSPNFKESNPSDRNALETSIHLDEGATTTTTNERPYQELQSMLTSALNQLDSMTKQIHVQRDEIQSLQEQNKDILLTQENIINENREMRASLLTLKTNYNIGQTQTEQDGASVSNDAPVIVWPEAKHAINTNLLIIGACLCFTLIAVLMYYNCERVFFET